MSNEDPRQFHEKPIHAQCVTVWCGFWCTNCNRKQDDARCHTHKKHWIYCILFLLSSSYQNQLMYQTLAPHIWERYSRSCLTWETYKVYKLRICKTTKCLFLFRLRPMVTPTLLGQSHSWSRNGHFKIFCSKMKLTVSLMNIVKDYITSTSAQREGF